VAQSPDAPLRPRHVSVSISAPRQLTTEADGMDVDWEGAGCVTRVHDQGTCRVGGAFSVVAAIETGLCIQSPTKRLVQLSVEDVAACSI
jgi:hypothetical protein